MLRRSGAAVLIGVADQGSQISIPLVSFVFKEIRVISSLMGSSPFQLFLPQLAQYYLDGRLKLDELVSQRIALPQINEAYARMAAGEVARSVIVF